MIKINKILAALAMVLTIAIPAFATQGSQRVYTALANVGSYARVLANAQITVCQYNVSSPTVCAVPVTVYQDPAMTTPYSSPFRADANGNYSYWAPAGNYVEQVCATGTSCLTQVVTLGGNVSVSPCGSAGQIQTANSAGTALDCDSNFTINSTTHTLVAGANTSVNAFSSTARNVVDPMDTKFCNTGGTVCGLAAAVAADGSGSGVNTTQVLQAAVNYAYCQTRSQHAPAGWIITPAGWTLNVDGLKLWSNQRLGGESYATATYFSHSGNVGPMISGNGATDTITCDGTVYTPGLPNAVEVAYIDISGRFTGTNDIGIYLYGFSPYVHDVAGWGQGFGQQAIWVNGQSGYLSHIGTPSGQIKGCQDYINGVSTGGVCESVQMDNLDGNSDFIYATDAAEFLTGNGPGACYPNCAAIGVNGTGSSATNLFAQVSDIGIMVAGGNVRGGQFRIDESSMDAVRFYPNGNSGNVIRGIIVGGACMSNSLQNNFNLGAPTGCSAIHDAHAGLGGNIVSDIIDSLTIGYTQCIVHDDVNSASGVSSIWGPIAYQGNPSNATSNGWAACGTNNQAASARWLFYNVGVPVTATTSTVNINGISALWIANGVTATTFTGGNGGQHVDISASPGATATLGVTGNFKTCTGLPVVLTNTNPIQTVFNAFTGNLDMVCNPPNQTPTDINWFDNPTPSDPSLLDEYGDVRVRQVPAFTNDAHNLHGPAAPSGQYCFEQENIYTDGSHNVSPLFCTTVDLTNQTPGGQFGIFAPQVVTYNLWLVSNTTGSSIPTGKYPPAGGSLNWDWTVIALGGDGTTPPPAGENNTGVVRSQAITGELATAPTGTCTAGLGGQLVISKDGHGTYCPVGGGTWTSKF